MYRVPETTEFKRNRIRFIAKYVKEFMCVYSSIVSLSLFFPVHLLYPFFAFSFLFSVQFSLPPPCFTCFCIQHKDCNGISGWLMQLELHSFIAHDMLFPSCQHSQSSAGLRFLSRKFALVHHQTFQPRELLANLELT